MAVKGVCDRCGSFADLNHYQGTQVRYFVSLTDRQSSNSKQRELCKECYDKFQALLDSKGD